MTLQESIGAFLREECPLITAAVASRVYWNRPPEHPTFPFIAFRKSGERDLTESIDWQASGLVSASIEFICMSRLSQSEACSVGAALTASLCGYDGACWTGRTPSTDGEYYVQGIRKTNDEDLSSAEYIEAGIYGVALAFEVIARPYTA